MIKRRRRRHRTANSNSSNINTIMSRPSHWRLPPSHCHTAISRRRSRASTATATVRTTVATPHRTVITRIRDRVRGRVRVRVITCHNRIPITITIVAGVDSTAWLLLVAAAACLVPTPITPRQLQPAQRVATSTARAMCAAVDAIAR